VLGQDEATAFLAGSRSASSTAVGAVSAAKLAADGYRLIADLQRADEHDLIAVTAKKAPGFGGWRAGIDARNVDPERDTKSISEETTFERDIGDFARSSSIYGI